MTEDLLSGGGEAPAGGRRALVAVAVVLSTLAAAHAWSDHVVDSRSRAADRAYLKGLQATATAAADYYNYSLLVRFRAGDAHEPQDAVRVQGISLDGGWLGQPTAVVPDVTIGEAYPGLPIRQVPPFALTAQWQLMELTFGGQNCSRAERDPPGGLVLTLSLPSGRRGQIQVPLRNASGPHVDWLDTLRRACPARPA